MNIPQFSVRRPIFTTMITLVVIIIGTVSLNRLRIDLLPNIELPTLSVRTGYEGASPEVMERLVTRILEEIIATVSGVEEMTSESSEGNSRIRVSFAWGANIDTAALDVMSRIEDEINELPDDIVRPRVRKYDIGGFPVVILGISGNLDPVELTQLIENQIRYRFSRVPGVAQVDLWGGFKREIRIELDPDRISALKIPVDQVIDAIRDANVDLPAGKIEEGRFEVALRAPAEFENLEQLRNTVILKKEGAVVRLAQIAEIKDTHEKRERIVRVNGRRGIRVAVRKQADANTVEVSKRIMAEIDAANKAFPQIEIVPVVNQGNFIERSIANVAQSVLYGGGLAIVVLLFFLRNIRSTLVISLAIPISIVATFALLYFGGFTLNLMTLGGLALGVGMMVDNSIVVLENIFRRIDESGESVDDASVNGANEVGTAIVASTITTLVIFLPLIFVRGLTGVLFKELAYVIIFSLLCSLLVALCLIPMLASRFMKFFSNNKTPGGRWIRKPADLADNSIKRLNNGYHRLLRVVLNHRWKTVFTAFAILGTSLLLLPYIGTEFLPPSDEGEVRVTGEMEIGTRLDIVNKQSLVMEDIVMSSTPEAVSSVVSVGATGWRANAVSRGSMNLSLTPAKERGRSNAEIAEDLRRRLSGKIPGMKIRTRAPQGQFLLERLLGGEEGLTVEVRGYDLDRLEILADKAAETLSGVSGVTDVETAGLLVGIPQEVIAIDRNKAADLGLSVRDVTETVQTLMAGSKAGEFRSQGDSCRIFVQLKDAEKRSLDEILNLTLITSTGEQAALRNLVATKSGRGPILIDRKDQQRLVSIEANVAGRDMGSVASDAQARLDRIPRPVGYDLRVSGKFEEQQKAFRELVVSLALALVLVYMVLACQYESLLDPLIVMASAPLAAVGVLLMLFLTKTTLNLQSYIGCIMLGGIVVNNAILLVDQAGRLTGRGMGVGEAVAEAGRRRLRPILMTTLTTVLALLPLALGVGEGADAQAPLARAVIGGLTGSTLITLVLIPAVYSLCHSKFIPKS